ncbi:MAG TPA: hypothetical protein VMF70_00265 [Gemmatimonadales bacterium]|nr:hypothetical protein [Gemmatimonadales bacterium]
MTAYWRTWAEAAALAAAVLAAPAVLAAQDSDLPPAGFGSLRQDQVAVTITTVNLAVRVLPLDEHVIRLLAPDTYGSLHALVQSKAGAIAAAARAVGRDSATVFFVTFFGLQPMVTFVPDQVSIQSQGIFYRPLDILPLSPQWTDARLDQRQQASAVYIFDPAIPISQTFTVFYGDQNSATFDNSLTLLQSERARVLARAAQQRQP